MKTILQVTRRSFIISSAGLVADYAFGPAFPPSDRVRVGIIGLGQRGVRHLDGCARTQNVEIAALCDLDPERLLKCQAMLGTKQRHSPARYTDYRDLLDRKDLDAVSIAVPYPLRGSIAISACRTGKHVFVEQPFASTPEECKELLKAAKQNSAIVSVARSNSIWNQEEMLHEPLRFVSRLDSVTGSRIVSSVPCSDGTACPDLAHTALDDIDLARHALNVDLPTQVAAFPMTTSNARINSSLMVFDFPRPHLSNAGLNWEVQRRVCASGAFACCKIAATFEGTNGAVSGQWSFPSHYSTSGDGEEAKFRHFIESVRKNQADHQSFPIQRAAVAQILTLLAVESARLGRALAIDATSCRLEDNEK